MSPTAAWLAAAKDNPPILVFRLPDKQAYFASAGAHYPVTGQGEPHHAGIIKAGGLPEIVREIQNIFSGRTGMVIGREALVDQGNWDTGFGDYDKTFRGARLDGYVTFPGLGWNDAELYLTSRILKIETTGQSEMTLFLIDATAEKLKNAMLAAGSYTSAKLGDVVKARLTAAGLAYPDDFDTTAWAAWVASGMPGDYTVTGSWSEGDVFSIIDQLVKGTLSWYGFRRDGKFFIEQFADLGASPSVDIDLTTAGTIIKGSSTAHYEPVMRQVEVKYNGGASSVIKKVNLLTTDPWWGTAREDDPVDCGLTLLADATTLADKRLALLSAEHLVSTVRVDYRPLAYNLGDTVKLDLAACHLPTGAPLYHRVVGIREELNRGYVELKLWTKVGGPPLS